MPPPAPSSDKPDAGKLRFAAPTGFDMEGKEPGDMIEFVATAEIEKDGRLCLKKANGIEVAGYAKPEPDTADFSGAVTGDTSEE